MDAADHAEIWDYRAGNVSMLVVRGDLDVYLRAELSRRLDDALAGPAAAVLIDLEEVTFMDAAALGVLVAARRRAADSNVLFRLVAPRPAVRRLLNITGTESLFSIEDDLAVAYSAVADTAPGISLRARVAESA